MSENKQPKAHQMNTKNETEIPPHVLESEQRKNILAKKMFEAMTQASEEVGNTFTTFEICDVLIRMAHQYNSEGLKHQYENPV